MEWMAYHIFCHNVGLHDQCIVKIKKWLEAENKKIDWFFIKYWEGGPHIRLRIMGHSKDKKKYLNKLYELLHDELAQESNLTKEKYYEHNKLDGEPILIDDLPWFKNGTIQQMPYMREIQRYGGEEWIEKAEVIFFHSSQLAGNCLVNHPNIFLKLMMYICVYQNIIENLKMKLESFDQKKYLLTCSNYWENQYGIEHIEYYHHLSNKLLDFEKEHEHALMELNKQMKKKAQIYIQINIENTLELTTSVNQKIARSVLFSQMHMLANRLGIPIDYEFAVYQYLIKKEVGIHEKY
ncbi:thiopeptide-type bacteriocin biosynthesis protein [Carnobacterium divergens]|uniref:Thiopeptide-type bacteriocin biosynthesis protein n=1 Tax=Carnobacterium divergens TaxID=2748 RepID=A0AAW8RGF0_CARDV|nr:thiopeptide-type bacteriocin biosynthesis protein [Carnobacterium divergens]MDT1959067.1 thiopeptide-type bacteriocin biosynthesis protein [Carnobacterium divergens]MDT1975176.1 thiopeptide-type bacteriocin biosynthesis protein [Carnobacterium divergens]